MQHVQKQANPVQTGASETKNPIASSFHCTTGLNSIATILQPTQRYDYNAMIGMYIKISFPILSMGCDQNSSVPS